MNHASTVRPGDTSRSLHPNRADYPPAEPIVCPQGPLLYANLDTAQLRAGHYYRRNPASVWVCTNCGEPRP